MALDIDIDQKKGVRISERGKAEDGSTIYSDRRLYMQLLAFTGAADTGGLEAALTEHGLPGVLYADVSDPAGVALLTYAEDPAFFVDTLRPFLRKGPFAGLASRPEQTITGRSYSIGYEKDLDDVLLARPIRHACHPEWPWAVWYPLKRTGEFAVLPADEQRTMLMEHGGIGRAYGRADLAHDIRLACHGLDANDNDFAVALLGRDLTPLSKVVERMRQTQQTARYMERMGPFIIGRAIWQNAVFPEGVSPAGSSSSH
ncbi:MAG: hypothetical protein HKN17_04405 [Rhodothermales bacterium]|nr:hypothetical protein [Rhodothermales bacterium]